MNDEDKSKEQLPAELESLRARPAQQGGSVGDGIVGNEIPGNSDSWGSRPSEELFHSLAENSPVGVYLTDTKGRCRYVNRRWCEMSGLRFEEALGDGWVKGLHPEDRRRIASAWCEMVAAHGSWGLEYRFRTPDGKSTWVHGHAAPLLDRNGKMIGYIGTNTDITERKQMENAQMFLAQSGWIASGEDFFEALARFLAEILDVDYVCIDLLEDDRLSARTLAIYFDGAFEDNLTYTLKDTPCGELVDKTVCCYPEGVRHFFPNDAVLREMSAESYVGTILWGSDGRPIGLIATIGRKPLGDPRLAESVLGLVGVRAAGELERRRAEEEKKKLEARLRESQKLEAVGTLAGGIAHDFNNLLQVINGYADMLLGDMDEGRPERFSLKEISMAGKRAASLVKQLLAFSRKQILNPEGLDMNEVVSQLLKMMGRLIGEHIRLDFVPGHRLGTVYADRGMMEQLLINLCVNARDAMVDGGSLIIETENVAVNGSYCETHPWASPGRYILVSVTDTGCGMDKETLDRVFEPFFTTKAQGKGTGLGLATVYGIVKQHQGMIHAYSEPGKGTTFKVYLPVAERLASDVGTKIESPAVGGKETILLAEDEEMVRKLAARILEREGYRVLIADNGEDALALFRKDPFGIDLLLLDVVMPKLGGKPVYEQARSLNPSIRALFASGYSENAIHTNFVLREGFRLIQKPFSREALLRAVREALDAPTRP